MNKVKLNAYYRHIDGRLFYTKKIINDSDVSCIDIDNRIGYIVPLKLFNTKLDKNEYKNNSQKYILELLHDGFINAYIIETYNLNYYQFIEKIINLAKALTMDGNYITSELKFTLSTNNKFTYKFSMIKDLILFLNSKFDNNLICKSNNNVKIANVRIDFKIKSEL